MPLLDRDGRQEDVYRRVPLSELANAAYALMPLSDLVAADVAPARGLGVEIDNTVAAETLRPFFEQLSLIAIRFPSFGDGRGFSLARQLRRGGFAGRMRAVGPLIADQLAFLLACGFDEVETTDDILARQPPSEWVAAAARMSLSYQRGYGGDRSILEQRRAGGAKAATR